MNKHMTSLISFICTLSILLCMILTPLNVYAVNEDNNLNEDNTTTGTQLNAMENESNIDSDIQNEIDELVSDEWEEIRISSAKDLVEFSKKCSLDIWSKNKYVVLVNDISLLGTNFTTIPTFGGVFDGQNHVITDYNMYESQSDIGLFSNIQPEGIVKNLNVVGRVIPNKTQSVVGGIAGNNYGVIVNCSFKGIIDGNDYVGGIAGINRLSGIISDSKVEGVILGKHFTGGLAGENMGNILRCKNLSEVNTLERDTSLSIEDINIDNYIQMFKFNNDDSPENASALEGFTDMGGISGLSIGVIMHCTNEGTVGYEKVGYNVGGIVGRQSGYVYNCTNDAKILGRKDVGGIVGQAEPYVAVNLTEDVIKKLDEGITQLHDLVDITLKDTDNQSDTMSNRLNLIKQFTDVALENTDYLSGKTIDYINGMSNAANDAIDRVEYIISESSKEGGPFDNTNSAVESMKKATEALIKTVTDLDVYSYMSEQDRADYDEYQRKSKEITEDYAKWTDESAQAYRQYYTDKIRSSSDWENSSGDHHNYTSGKFDERNMCPVINDDTPGSWTPKIYSDTEELIKYKDLYDYYKDVTGWKHVDGVNKYDYPEMNSGNTYYERDQQLEADVADSSGRIKELTKRYADGKYSEKYGTSASYEKDMAEYSVKMATIVSKYTDEMSDDAKKDANTAINNVNDASKSMNSAGTQTKDTLKNVHDRGTINLPTLDEAYKQHTVSLNNSLQGMSDNFGLLNEEMNSGTDVMVGDLSNVNDQFSNIMDLYKDAMNTLINKDVKENIQDMSKEVANICIDATIADSINLGCVEGTLNVSGIAGCMGVEYDFDPESDITGNNNSDINTAYLTKCVLRNDKNKGLVNAEKSYVGGVCGSQEIGTILRCMNLSKITSNTGEYIGAIAGISSSDIVSSYAKGILSGERYIGGLAGKGHNIEDCYSLVLITDADDYKGAIAGDVDSEGYVRNNFFTSEDLSGINRISYSKKAEPLSYEELVSKEDIPAEFNKLSVVFLLDDEDNEDRVELGVSDINYGFMVSKSDYPKVPSKNGYYYVWDNEDNMVVTTDLEITASYVKNVTTLASKILRDTKQSAFLVDGQFTDQDEFEAFLTPVANDSMDNAIEYWELSIPDDGATTHQLRYSLPDEYKDVNKDDFSIYYHDGGQWIKVTDIGTMGKYYTFSIPRNIVKIQIVNDHKAISMKMIILIAASILVLAIVVLLTIVICKQKKNKTNSKTDSVRKE